MFCYFLLENHWSTVSYYLLLVLKVVSNLVETNGNHNFSISLSLAIEELFLYDKQHPLPFSGSNKTELCFLL